MVTVPRPKPIPEVLREKELGHAVGMNQKARSDAEEARRAEEERKAAPPTERTEIWTFEKQWGPYSAGRWEIKICRDTRGKFAKPYGALQLAEHYSGLNLMTGADIPSPKKKRS